MAASPVVAPAVPTVVSSPHDKFVFDVVFGRSIGSGAFFQVKEAYLRRRPRNDDDRDFFSTDVDIDTSCVVVVKCIRVGADASLMKESFENANKEYIVLQKLQTKVTKSRLPRGLLLISPGQSDHVLLRYGALVMEHAGQETLKTFLKRDAVLSPRQVFNMALSLLRDVKVLADSGIVHRDIAPQNIIVNGDNLRLIDYGSAVDINHPPDSYPGSTPYTLTKTDPDQNTASADIFAVGGVLQHLLCQIPDTTVFRPLRRLALGMRAATDRPTVDEALFVLEGLLADAIGCDWVAPRLVTLQNHAHPETPYVSVNHEGNISYASKPQAWEIFVMEPIDDAVRKGPIAWSFRCWQGSFISLDPRDLTLHTASHIKEWEMFSNCIDAELMSSRRHRSSVRPEDRIRVVPL